jgi:hypothetical protein
VSPAANLIASYFGGIFSFVLVSRKAYFFFIKIEWEEILGCSEFISFGQ